MEHTSKIYLAGHTGLVGSAIHRNLIAKGYHNFVLRTVSELDLTRQLDVEAFFASEKPEYVFVAAAKVGGIVANNTYRAQFISENLMIQNNIIHSAWLNGVKKLLFLGSTCIYPADSPQPMKEEYLLTGPLEPTNEPYAIAKIAGIKMCENYFRQYGSEFISVMPTNLYGPNDNFDLEKSHVLPALLRKIHLAGCLETGNWDTIRTDLDNRPIEGITGRNSHEKILEVLWKYGIRINSPGFLPECQAGALFASVRLWGTGTPLREFLYVEDMADACVYVMENVSASYLYDLLKKTQINIGTGEEITIRELALLISKITGFRGEIVFDRSKPDGVARKLTDPSLIHSLGWRHKTSLRDGIEKMYHWYKQSQE